MRDDLRRVMHEFLANMHADACRADFREASGLIVVLYDPETGQRRYFGPFDKNTAEAWEFAETTETGFNTVNAGDGPDIVCSIHLLFPPD